MSIGTAAPTLEAYLELEMLSGRRLLGVIGNQIITGDSDHSEAGFKGSKTLTNATTNYQVSTDSVPCRGVLIFPHPSNTGRVWIAIGAVAAAGQGAWLDPTSPPIPLPVLNLNLVNALAETAGDKVTWIGRV